MLSDDAKRREYDELRALFGAGGFRAAPRRCRRGAVRPRRPVRPGGAAGLGDVFGGLFGGGSRRRAGRGPRRGADVEAEVTLEFADAVRGATVPLRLTTPGACDTCHGTGATPGTAPAHLPVCAGQGVTSRNQGGFAFAEPCRDCRGGGRVVDTPCPSCRGSGATSQERTLTVRIPAGVADGQRIRLAGRGGPGERGGPAGDLLRAGPGATAPAVRPQRATT